MFNNATLSRTINSYTWCCIPLWVKILTWIITACGTKDNLVYVVSCATKYSLVHESHLRWTRTRSQYFKWVKHQTRVSSIPKLKSNSFQKLWPGYIGTKKMLAMRKKLWLNNEPKQWSTEPQKSKRQNCLMRPPVFGATSDLIDNWQVERDFDNSHQRSTDEWPPKAIFSRSQWQPY